MYRNIPRDKQPEKGNPLPPQIFNDDRYCGVRGGDGVMFITFFITTYILTTSSIPVFNKTLSCMFFPVVSDKHWLWSDDDLSWLDIY